jgi:hypothetical protein
MKGRIKSLTIRFKENCTSLHEKNVFRIIKNLINSLPDDTKMTINGKPVETFSVFISQNYLKIDLVQNKYMLGSLEHDGCEGCKYEFTYPNLDEEPCLSYRQNHMDNYERVI